MFMLGRESGRQVEYRKKEKPSENSTECLANPLYQGAKYWIRYACVQIDRKML